MKSQRDESDESARLILQVAEAQQVIDALLLGFHVTIQHSGVGAQPDLVSLARDVQPHLSADFVVADDFAHPRMKNLRASAGQRIHAGLFELEQSVSRGQLGNAREVAHLDHGESFQMHARAALFEPTNQLKKMVKGEVRMQATDNVEFGGAFTDTLLRALINFFQREGVRAGGVRVAPKGAKLAVCYANVRWINVPVN